MSSLEKITSAQQSRLNYKKIRLASPKVVADPPKLHADNPLLPDTTDDLPNQLHRMYQGAALKVLVPRPAVADDPGSIPGVIQLMWNETRVGARYNYTTPLDPAILEIELTLPENLSNQHGTHQLGYYLNQGGNPTEVTPLTINVDTQRPVTNGAVIVPPEVDRDGITKKYLDDNGFVQITLLEYLGKKIGDVIEFYFGKSMATSMKFDEITRTDTSVPVVSDKLTASVVGEEEGQYAIFYFITNRKGYRSEVSLFKQLNVMLTDPPEGLLPPDIPLYDNGLIDLADAQTPVGVGIKAQYTNFVSGDQLLVTWDGIPQPPKTIVGFPVYVDVPFRDVFNNDPGEKTVTVEYQVQRGTNRFPLTPLSMDVDVDMRKPGGVIDPGNPDPVNPDLDPVTVQGQGGNPVNVLTEADKDQDVDVSVVIYEGAKDKDEAQLFWKGVPVPEANGGIFKVVGTPVPPARITWTIDWSVVADGKNGKKLPVHYEITHPDVNENKDISPNQIVDVEIVPGVVPEAKFQNLDPDFTDWLNCGSLRQDAVKGTVVEVLVAGGEPQLADQDLVFKYQGYTDNAGTVKPGTDLEVPYKPTAQEAADGFIVKIPYAPVLATENAWGDISYTAVIDGRPVPSVPHLVRVYLIDPGDGGTCKITRR
ncbi:hypothetical protein PMI34_05241 [Pseudomonas sp. GM74]|uniref:hypothetical protein n=1 Tax=Pseudomonas sp. GM74 TaxID=1144336 RepID=UPI0002705BB2|nr:hypothetical protein [Pseudomonas sp. GM74]EJM81190.1 hypothetical protein PMI34_05241 [Pseudomonas sp. GM74]